jgi:hypothetical protein
MIHNCKLDTVYLCLITVKAVIPTRPEFPGMKGWKPKPEDPNSNRWIETKNFWSENGDEVYLNYNALVTERVIPLDYEDHVEDVICPSHGLCILLYDSRSPIQS